MEEQPRWSDFFRRQAWEEARTQLVHAGITASIPLVATAVTLLAGYLQGTPIAYVMAATGTVFMTFCFGVLGFALVLFQRNPEEKLRIAGPILGKRYAGKKVVGIKYGLQHTNIALFPIQFEVRPLHVSLGASINPNPQRNITGGTSQIGAR